MADSEGWAYHLVLRPGPANGMISLVAVSGAGHLNTWLVSPCEGSEGSPTVREVLEALYAGCLNLMEMDASLGG